jgi:hypothetical protein
MATDDGMIPSAAQQMTQRSSQLIGKHGGTPDEIAKRALKDLRIK